MLCGIRKKASATDQSLAVCDQVPQEPSTPTVSMRTEVRKKSINLRIKMYVGLSQMYFVHRDIESDFYMVLFIFSGIFSPSM